METKIYTDGACIGNPGPGGWAAIILAEGKQRKILWITKLFVQYFKFNRST